MRAGPRSHVGLVIVMSGLALGPGFAAEDTLKTVLTTEEYQQAGLDKLNAGEQAALLQTMQRRGLAKLAQAANKPAEEKGPVARVMDFGAEQLPAKKTKEEIENRDVDAQMTEPFRGLQGGTIFRLDNGQVWQQRIPETYYIGKPIPNPKVTIRRTRMGYRLLIPAVEPDFAVAVKRIQ